MSNYKTVLRKAVKPILKKHNLDGYLFEVGRGSLFQKPSVTLLNFKDADMEKYNAAAAELDMHYVSLKYREMI